MMEVVAPLGIESIAAAFDRQKQTRIVEVALGDNVDEPTRPPADCLRHFLHRPEGCDGRRDHR